MKALAFSDLFRISLAILNNYRRDSPAIKVAASIRREGVWRPCTGTIQQLTQEFPRNRNEQYSQLPMLNAGEEHGGWFLFLFVAQSLICLGLLCWYEIVYQTTGHEFGTGVTIDKGMASLIVFVAAETVVILERYEMFAEKYLRRRCNEGFRKAPER